MRSGIENVVRPGSMLKTACGIAVIALCVPTHAIAQAPAHEPEEGTKAIKHVMVRVAGQPGGEAAASPRSRLDGAAGSRAAGALQRGSGHGSHADARRRQPDQPADRVEDLQGCCGTRAARAGECRASGRSAPPPRDSASSPFRTPWRRRCTSWTRHARKPASCRWTSTSSWHARRSPAADVMVDRRVERKIVIARAGGEQAHVTEPVATRR